MAVLWWFRIIEAVGKRICWATCAYQPPLSLDACAWDVWDGCVDVGEDGQGWVIARKRNEGACFPGTLDSADKTDNDINLDRDDHCHHNYMKPLAQQGHITFDKAGKNDRLRWI